MNREFLHKHNAFEIAIYKRNPTTGARVGECVEIFSINSPMYLIEALKERGYEVVENKQNRWGSYYLTVYKA